KRHRRPRAFGRVEDRTSRTCWRAFQGRVLRRHASPNQHARAVPSCDVLPASPDRIGLLRYAEPLFSRWIVALATAQRERVKDATVYEQLGSGPNGGMPLAPLASGDSGCLERVTARVTAE